VSDKSDIVERLRLRCALELDEQYLCDAIECEAADEIERLRSEISRLREDNDEQCRLHGVGSQRELRQLAVIEEQAREIARLREERRWVPVGERLPKPGETVLMLMDGIDPVSGWYENGHFHNAYDTLYVTHWMPLPPGPEEDG
jgi:hypothetical protein